jgi:hypothetical protein
MNQLLFIAVEVVRICFRYISPGNLTEVNPKFERVLGYGFIFWVLGLRSPVVESIYGKPRG